MLFYVKLDIFYNKLPLISSKVLLESLCEQWVQRTMQARVGIVVHDAHKSSWVHKPDVVEQEKKAIIAKVSAMH
jgi:hypothetical protein